MIRFVGNVPVGFINPWTGEEVQGNAMSDHDDDSLHGKSDFSFSYLLFY